MAPALIEEAQWNEHINSALSDPAARSCIAWLKREVVAGRSQLWRCTAEGATLYVITRLDENPTEWVICYVQGQGVANFAPYFLALAEKRGWPMRVHTTSRAVARLVARYRFELQEYVLRRDADGSLGR